MNFDDVRNAFTPEKLRRDFLVTLTSILCGIALFVGLLFLGKLAGNGTALFFLLQNIGYFLLFGSVFLAYAAVHRGNARPDENSIRVTMLNAAKMAPIVLGILICSILFIFVVALVELVPVFLGYIPYAGPVIVALLSVPFFMINFALVLAVGLVWIIAPPMVAEGTPLKSMPMEFYTLARKRGAIILAYAAAIVMATAVLFMPVLMAVRYSAGITRAVEWNIAPAYPAMFKAIMRPSYVTDVITKLAPKTDPIAVLQQYGSELFNYIEMLGNLLKLLYGVMLAGIVAFMVVVFANLLSIAYTRVKKDIRP